MLRTFAVPVACSAVALFLFGCGDKPAAFPDLFGLAHHTTEFTAISETTQIKVKHWRDITRSGADCVGHDRIDEVFTRTHNGQTVTTHVLLSYHANHTMTLTQSDNGGCSTVTLPANCTNFGLRNDTHPVYVGREACPDSCAERYARGGDCDVWSLDPFSPTQAALKSPLTGRSASEFSVFATRNTSSILLMTTRVWVRAGSKKVVATLEQDKHLTFKETLCFNKWDTKSEISSDTWTVPHEWGNCTPITTATSTPMNAPTSKVLV